MLLALALAALTSPAGLHSPGPAGSLVGPVKARSLAIAVRVIDGVATTRLQLRLANEGSRQEEALWILPLPEGASVDDFRMRAGGIELTGEVLEAQRARGVYEAIVSSQRDPGLLEYLGRSCLRARVFPVLPHKELEVEVTWREILAEVGGLRRWSFPVAAAGLAGAAPESVTLDLSIESRRALLNVFSSTPGLEVVREGDHRARASFEGCAESLPARELALFHGLTEAEFGLDLLSTRTAGEQQGSFLMLISPRRELAGAQAILRSIAFVLDTSGSMQGRKLEQAKAALRFFLGSLREGETFDVVPFATAPEPFFPSAVPADSEHIATALRRVAELEANGGTNIDEALRSGLQRVSDAGGRVPIVVLLTDGLPTVQETEVARILEHAGVWNVSRARVFALGVGHDVNTLLIDRLSGDHGGTRGYIGPEEDIEIASSALLSALSRPVLTDLQLAVEGVELERVVPSALSDLFHGGRLSVFGRYRGAGPATIRLGGTVAGERRTFTYEASFADGPVAAFDFVPSLWAERRVAVLLDELRLRGPSGELVDEVRRLGVEHGIVTPYTSHLILEQGLALPPASGGGGVGTRRGAGDTVPPGGGGPATPGPAGPSTAGGRGPATGIGSAPGDPEADIDQIATRLRQAGVLPAGASPQELRELALEVGREMRAADRALRGLGREQSGAEAVAESAYLARLMRSHGSSTGSDEFYLGRGHGTPAIDLLKLFTRRVKDRTFDLRKGVWTDRALPVDAGERTIVEAFSKAWFDLLAAKPALRPYFAFSTRLAVALDGAVFEVRPPATD